MYNVPSMKYLVVAIFTVLVFASLLPFSGGAQERQSLDITSLKINFEGTDAVFTVNYDLGALSRLYVLLLGSKNMEPILKSVFSEFDYQIIKMDQDNAVLKVKGFARYEKGYFLHDSRKLGETIRTIYIYTPDSARAREFSNLNSTPPMFYRS